jgi:hypothetical protein
MSLVDINWRPERKDLRKFAVAAMIASLLISVLLYVIKGMAFKWAAVIIAAGIFIFLSSFICIKVTRIIYITLISITFPIGYVASFILLAAFYFLLLTPLALFFRLIGRDPLCRKFNPDAKTYWLSHRSTDNLERYFHQY